MAPRVKRWPSSETLCVYLLTHRATGLQYVGMTRDLAARLKMHEHMAARDPMRAPITKAIADEGLKAFAVEALRYFPGGKHRRGVALAVEREEIMRRGCKWPDGFNVMGGESLPKCRERSAAWKASVAPESQPAA